MIRIERAELGAAIRRLREIRGLKLADMAEAAGTDAANLSRLERGQQGYSDQTLTAIAVALQIPLSELFKQAEQHQLQIGERRAVYGAPVSSGFATFSQASPATQAFITTVLALSAEGRLPDELVKHLLYLLRAAAGVEKTKK